MYNYMNHTYCIPLYSPNFTDTCLVVDIKYIHGENKPNNQRQDDAPKQEAEQSFRRHLVILVILVILRVLLILVIGTREMHQETLKDKKNVACSRNLVDKNKILQCCGSILARIQNHGSGSVLF